MTHRTPIIIPVFIPHAGCLERCLFCNQKAAGKGISLPTLKAFIETSLAKIPLDHRGREIQIAFYGGSFTAMDREVQLLYLKEVQSFLSFGRIDSIRVSTRPDALDEETLAQLHRYGTKTVEIGAQSMEDEVLLLSNRGHRAEDTVSAMDCLRDWGFEIGIQLMMGLPGDTLVRFLYTLEQMIELKPDFLRIHPTLVLKGAPLESLWRGHRYLPLSLDETIRWLKAGLLKLRRHSIRVARIGLQPTPELEDHLLAGPYHPALRHFVDSAITYDMAARLLETSGGNAAPVFLCHPQEISNLRGQRNENIHTLRTRFRLQDVCIQEEGLLPREYLVLQTSQGNRSMSRMDLRYDEH